MEIYQKLDLINKSPKSIVTIGTFDGCHRGHQDIIKKVISLSQSNNCKSVLITFDPHPRHILESSNKLPLLMHIDKKLEIFESLNLDIALIIPFDREFSKFSACLLYTSPSPRDRG